MTNYILHSEKDFRNKRHDTLAEANQEAARLCAKDKCHIFIYKLISGVRPKETPVEFVSYEEGESV